MANKQENSADNDMSDMLGRAELDEFNSLFVRTPDFLRLAWDTGPLKFLRNSR